ncbi:hypothetical protein WJX81_000107 [Elliptochloris bilobata]|uniref:THO complex subunit 7 n=1 Tax=Elliptochloris bilobata TaxID=381761 RepID=A0AAW1SCC2_9CHLO
MAAVAKAPPATPEEQATIKTRILTHVFASKGEPPPKKLATSWVQYGRAVQANSSDKAAKLQTLLVDLAHMEDLANLKTATVRANHREQAELAQRHAALENVQEAATAETQEARAGMAQARVRRKEEEEYERLREDLMKVPGRDTTREEADTVSAEIAALQADIERADATIELRRKQFAAFLHCLDELQAAMSADKGGEDGEALAAPPAGTPPAPPPPADSVVAMEA